MSLAVRAEAPPLREEADGAVRVGNSRVLLELVVRAFQDGATPESIAQRYETLSLADVYSVLAYYLHHRDEVEEYLAERERKAEDVRRRLAGRQDDLGGIRARLLAARPKQG